MTGLIQDALSRTSLLVQRDLFPSLSDDDIVHGLTRTAVEIVADASNLATPAGQAAAVAAAIAIAQCGATVRLDMPDVPLRGFQPPLVDRGDGLATSLAAHISRLPQARHSPLSTTHLVVLGDSPLPRGTGAGVPVLRIAGTDFTAELRAGAEPLNRWSGTHPFGAALAAAAVSAELFRWAMRSLGEAHRVAPLPEHRLAPSARVSLVLPPVPVDSDLAAEIDVVSAGAITNAALFALQREPHLHPRVRVFDDDVVQISNLNRYPLLNLGDLGAEKVRALAESAPGHWDIQPVSARLDGTSVCRSLPLAPHVIVGADDIPTRWFAQRHAPGWLAVAGTSHFETVVSEHLPNGPCAGCMHPRDEPDEGPLPTIAFVSLFAGTLLAHRLLRHLATGQTGPPLVSWPLALDGAHGMLALRQPFRADCPVDLCRERHSGAHRELH